MEMLLTGDFINAKKAKEIGLINNVVEEDLSERSEHASRKRLRANHQ